MYFFRLDFRIRCIPHCDKVQLLQIKSARRKRWQVTYVCIHSPMVVDDLPQCTVEIVSNNTSILSRVSFSFFISSPPAVRLPSHRPHIFLFFFFQPFSVPDKLLCKSRIDNFVKKKYKNNIKSIFLPRVFDSLRP